MEKTIEIPEGYKARIEGNKVILEPKENEDERIKNFLIGKFREIGEIWHEYSTKDIIAWLEKQGSQNLANSEKTCKDEQKPTLPGFEEQEGVAGRDYIPVEWVEAIENYGKWKIVRVNEQNPAWSEEDEIGFRDAMWAIEQARTIAINENDMGNLWYAENWLKSLKERYTWKPSDEHYELKEFANIVRGNLTGISNDVQEKFEAKYLQLTGNKMYGGYKD